MQPHTRATSRRYLLVLMDELYPCLRLRTKGEQFNAIPQFVPPLRNKPPPCRKHVHMYCTRTKHIKYLPARTATHVCYTLELHSRIIITLVENLKQAPCVLSGAMPKRTACQRVGGGPG
ncbi:unnamed protein product, partial [Ectocarpus sp. 12 AP-2014]